MDNIDNFSECSQSSRNSECLSSDTMTVSSLSEYQNEFLELQQLLKSECGSIESKKSDTVISNIVAWYEKQIENLKFQLQCSLKQSETHALEVHNAEKDEKIQGLLQQNQQLEHNLSSANNQIQRLLNMYNKNRGDTNNEEKNVELEEINYKLTNQNYLLLSQINRLNSDNSQIECESKNLRMELSKAHLELTAKINVVNELKKKISEQHVQIQELSEDKSRVKHSFDLISNDLEYVRKSEGWCWQQLRQLQEERSKLNDKFLANEKVIAGQEDIIEQLKLELSNLKYTCDKVRLISLKEKEELLKEFNHHMMKNEPDKKCCDINTEIIKDHYERIISDLKIDVLNIKSDFDNQQRVLENASKEKSDILKENLLLRNCLTKKEIIVQNLEAEIHNLNSELLGTTNKQKEQASELLDFKKRHAKLKTELISRDKDKETFEKTVNNLKEQVKSIVASYVNLKKELSKKTGEVLQLQNEKQETMNTSTKIKTIEKFVKGDSGGQFNTQTITLQAGLGMLQSNLVDSWKSSENYLASSSNLQHSDFQDCASLPPVGTVNVVEILANICNICKINDDVCINYIKNYNQASDDLKNHYVQQLLNTVYSHLQFLSQKAYKKSSTRRKDILARISELVNRCQELEIKNEDNTKVLKELCNGAQKMTNLDSEVRRLRICLQVKAREEKDKQQRYERNYRTLLAKVKEHMKGRKTAEKYNKHLLELHNTISDQCNTLKLQLDLKNSKLQELQACMESLLIKKELKIKDDNLLVEIPSKNTILKGYSDVAKTSPQDCDFKILNLETELAKEVSLNKQLREELSAGQSSIFKIQNENTHLNRRLELAAEKNIHLSEEIQQLNSCLQRKSEEVNELQLWKENSGRRWLEKEKNTQNVITALKGQIYELKTELDSIKNEKFFLRRLCSDLKVTLRQNKSFQEFIEKISKDKEKSDDKLILSSFPSPVNCNDVNVDKLLEENQRHVNETPLGDIQECLNTLRKEIFLLQEQIAEKNAS